MKNICYYYLFLGYLLSSYLLACSARATTTNITIDQSALLSLRAQITSDPHQFLANWSPKSSVCKWVGVACESRHRRVTALNIANMNLTGTIPPQLGNLSFLVYLNMSRNNFRGELPHELSQLCRLQVLDFGVNDLGGELPSSIGSLQKLQYLSLRNNSFTGSIPPGISNMSNLEMLWLSYNSLEGTIPKEIGNLPNLKNLYMFYNQLSGPMPAEIFNISSLERVVVSSNRLTGGLPIEICRQHRMLTWLDLSDNRLSGEIPSTLSQCSKLQVLGLSFNNFTGSIPKEIGSLTELEELYLDNNNLTGVIPQEVGHLHNLMSLSMEVNKLTGYIPRNFGNFTFMVHLYLGYNQLTGTIPQELGNLQNLEGLSLRFNKLTGSIPVQLFNVSTLQILLLPGNNLSGNLPSTVGSGLINLEKLYLNGNDFEGVIQASISNASNLVYLSLAANRFSGPIPNSLGDLRLLKELSLFQNKFTNDPSSPELTFISRLTNCKNLTILGFGDNPLHGILPTSVGNLSTSLEELYGYRSIIKGNIPEAIGNLSNLWVLSLFGNQLSGPIPVSVKNLQKLQVLDLNDNQLSGYLPDTLCGLNSLYEINLGQNRIQGSIPPCLGSITSLRKIRFGRNLLNSTIPASLWSLNDLLHLDLSSNSFSGSLPQEIQNLKVVVNLDLSVNHISGSIPSSMGGWQSLSGLSLAQNRLEGSIPDSLGSVLSLELLDLSSNNLSGSIPKSLEKLTHLTSLNLSFNNLTGVIPSVGPFMNFTSQSFISNPMLCGAPRFLVPPCTTSPFHSSSRKKTLLVLCILSGTFAIMIALTSAILFVRYRRKNVLPTAIDLSPKRATERISYYELLQATNGYDETNLLGSGSFGSVYKGTRQDGVLVAVKVFSLQMEETFKSFDAECEVLSNLRHRNLTKVIGCCSNLDFKALVLNYMSNGSLEKWLYSHNHYLDLMQRLDIMIDVASALQYLHHGYTTPVVHCDLKPSNILLDENMVAYLSDFGITKFLDEENSVLHTKTLATLGYIAPEYGFEGLVSTRSDVYSFGVVLMETFTRMKPGDDMFSGDMSLKRWIEDSLPETTFQVIDTNLLGPEDEYFTEKLECISLVLELALNCCTVTPRDRINMIDAVASLKKIKHRLQRFCKGT